VVSVLETRRPFSGYADGREPLDAYLLLTGMAVTGLAAGLGSAARRGRLPDRVGVHDVVTIGLATHKVARLLTKDSVTSFLRAPFVRLEEKSGTNSVTEHPRGDGLQRAVGELLSCPECTGQWVASGLVVGLLHAPRVTRAVTGLYSALALADLMQFAYVGLKSRA
jgi:hypothetical protein